MSIPNWYQTILLSVAAWRTFQLLAHDDILDRPRRWLLKLGNEWENEGDPVPTDYRGNWALFLTCSYCAGAWIAVGWWIAFQWSAHWSVAIATPLIFSAVVIALAKKLGSEE